MRYLRFLVRVALASAPDGYRREYRAAIESDIERAARERGFRVAAQCLMNIASAAIAERAVAFGRELRVAWRSLLRTPGFTAIAVGTLALSIAANVAVFTIVDTVLLRPLPYPAGDRLVVLNDRLTWRTQVLQDVFSAPDLRDIVRQSRTLASVAAYEPAMAVTLSGMGTARALSSMAVSPQFFQTFGVRPQLGRFFEAHAGDAVVVSDALWRRTFGADPAIVGRRITIDGKTATVVGVSPRSFIAPPDFYRAQRADLYRPLPRASPQRLDRTLAVWARLKDGASPRSANAELAIIAARLRAAFPTLDDNLALGVTPGHEAIAGNFRPLLLILAAGVLMLLLIACANVANMLLARGLSREREVAVRAAVGASRKSIVGLFLMESLLLAATASAAGLGAAAFTVQVFVASYHVELAPFLTIAITPGVFLFMVATLIAVTLLCGIIPAVALARGALAGILQRASRGNSGSARSARVRTIFVAVEIALTLALAINAGLLVKSFATLIAVNPGFRSADVLVLRDAIPATKDATDSPRRKTFARRLLAGVSTLPGVDDAALASVVPLSGTTVSIYLRAIGQDTPKAAPAALTSLIEVSPHFLTLMGIPIVRGRNFTSADDPNTVAIVDRSYARKAFGTEDPIGMRVVESAVSPSGVVLNGVGHMPVRRIIGVVATTHFAGRRLDTATTVYELEPRTRTNVFIRSRIPVSVLAQEVTALYARLDRAIVPPAPEALDALAASDTEGERTSAATFTILGLVALTMALAGIYAVMSYDIGRRRKEIGIRLALGAGPAAIMREIIRRVAIITGVACLAGLALAALLAQGLADQLYGTTPLDPATFLAGTAAVAACSILAAYGPARAVTVSDPNQTLRFE